jgi:hypothetical protein
MPWQVWDHHVVMKELLGMMMLLLGDWRIKAMDFHRLEKMSPTIGLDRLLPR